MYIQSPYFQYKFTIVMVDTRNYQKCKLVRQFKFQFDIRIIYFEIDSNLIYEQSIVNLSEKHIRIEPSVYIEKKYFSKQYLVLYCAYKLALTSKDLRASNKEHDLLIYYSCYICLRKCVMICSRNLQNNNVILVNYILKTLIKHYIYIMQIQ